MMGLGMALSAMLHSRTSRNAQLASMAEPVAAAWKIAATLCLLPTQLATSPAGPLYGTVNSFGLGGTIANAVLRVSHGKLITRPSFACMYRRHTFLWKCLLRAEVAYRGAISGLVLSPQPAFAAPLAHDELELQVRAVGLNFRDVLLVLGEYPGPPEPPGNFVVPTVEIAAQQK